MTTIFTIPQTLDSQTRILETIVDLHSKQGVALMALADDVAALTSAVSDLKAEVAAEVAQMDANFQALLASLGHAASNPGIVTATESILQSIQVLKAAVTRDTPTTP